MFLAGKLRMTLAGMRAELGNGEFMLWRAYYGREAQRMELAQAKAKG